ncbi:MAG: acylphosphatase [Candidatus Omnitrophica bacterium]|nr:acylphosphatase [Candidatus Omnitrophota bacterium]
MSSEKETRKQHENRRVHVFYSGRVQGVGFRFTVERLAAGLELRGWVRNLSDGRVEMVCEGRESGLVRILEKIDSSFSGYIRQKDINWKPYSGEFSNFDIRFF